MQHDALQRGAKPLRGQNGAGQTEVGHTDVGQNNSASARLAADPWTLGATPLARRVDLLSLIPLVAIVTLLILVGALVWLVNRTDEDRARTKLATDALWVEQTLRFQLSVDEDMLVRMALEGLNTQRPAPADAVASGGDILESRARLHIAANPEVLSVIWYDAQGNISRAVPGRSAPSDAELIQRLLRNKTVSSRPIYGQIAGARVSFAMRPQEDGGAVAVTISLPLMLERHIPWWIAEQYSVQLAASDGTTLAERARRAPDGNTTPHSISFDPPLRGTTLQISPYAPSAAFANTLILAAIAGLTGFAILALLALYRNATRRRHAELRLRGEMAFRRSMEDSLTVGLRAKDHNGRILYVNQAFCNLVGWPAETLIGHDAPMPYWAPDQLTATLARHRALAEGGAKAQAFETYFRRSDGSTIDVQVYEAPLIDAQGTHRGWMGSVIDITDSKRAAKLARAQDESLARTGRLVTLGEMASTLAHELNQPLSAIASYAAGGLNLLERGQSDPAMLTQALEKMQVQSRRAGQIIRGIQDFVKKREPRFDDVQLSDIIRETIGFLAATARENQVQISADLAPVGTLRADRILLEQVLINLIRNGIEAMQSQRHGDQLTVSLRPKGNGAVIEIADQGSGIAPEIDGHLFDAFSSTKSEGMGMGLNICRSIIELHRGQLTHHARPGGGTIFSVVLPAIAQEEVA
ncbi:PAS domain-containing sensor histidine kinase [Cypionkella aquatica]|uniref:histidine kinase n=1 Tax=Cypionkella aquatica TaxID=1756042 RepID=A0AA37TVP9_9RHOB|nr:PAS domain S-box protein [Cypionkella aquatica]GLS86753.1 PAS domain-containing sensor histidine kinase [Cypionkella aquatica]